MKKLFYSAGLCLLAVACKQSPDQFKLTGSGISSSNDIYVYDVAGNKSVDTIKVDNGNFTYTLDSAGEPKLLVLTNNQDLTRYIVAEKGDLTLAGDTGVVKGAPLNDRLADFFEAYKKTGEELEEKKAALLRNAEKENRELTREEVAELQVLDKEQSTLLAGLVKKYYENDKGTVLGVLQLIFIQGLATDEEFTALYEQGGEAVKNFPPFIKMFESKANMEKTKVGEKFVDFEGVNPKNTAQTLKLSDFAGKGKYVLLDFWASWCGPCRQAMPEIKMLNDQYSGKGLEVIGVVISDQIEDHLKVAEELNVTWAQIFDNKNEIAVLYGIKGIPTLILLDKDGTILIRTFDKDEVIEKIENLL